MAIEIRIGGDCAADMPHLAGIRYTVNRSVIARAFHGVPDWVREHETGGGVHSLDTCGACATAYYLRWVWRQGTSEQACESLAKEYETNKREQDAEYLVGDEAESQAMVSAAQRKQTERIMRVAARCPVKRLPRVIAELESMYDQYSDLTLGGTQGAQHPQAKVLARACSLALGVARSRWHAVESDPLDMARLRLRMS